MGNSSLQDQEKEESDQLETKLKPEIKAKEKKQSVMKFNKGFIIICILLGLFGFWIFLNETEQYSEIPSHLLIKNGGLSFEKNSREPFTGVSVKYHKNGQAEEKITFKAGKEISKITFDYHENGELRIKSNYKDGKLDGCLEYYGQNGQRIFKEAETFEWEPMKMVS